MCSILLLVLCTFALVSQAIASAPSSSRVIHGLVSRSVDPNIVPPQCKTQCAAIVNTVNTCTSAACLCQQVNVRNMVTCFDCVVTVVPGPTEVFTLQNTVNEYCVECDFQGFILAPIAIKGGVAGTSLTASAQTGFIPALANTAVASNTAVNPNPTPATTNPGQVTITPQPIDPGLGNGASGTPAGGLGGVGLITVIGLTFGVFFVML